MTSWPLAYHTLLAVWLGLCANAADDAPPPTAHEAPKQKPPVPQATLSAPLVETLTITDVYTILMDTLTIRDCFLLLVDAPVLPPAIDLDFVIVASGEAGPVTVRQPSYRGSALERCLSDAISHVVFPPARNEFRVHYPFVLRR